jgi:arylsulfatase A-like enzyme
MLLLGALVLSFVVYTARADGDDHVGQAPPPVPESSAEMPERPDIILITVDTLRADRLGAYGYAKANTPNIDAMGESGIVFANATVPLPRTTPGLASLLTGLGIHSHGSREVWEPVRVEKGQRLAEVLGNDGYVTLGLSANSAAGTRQKLAVGFDKFYDYGKIKKQKKRADADVMTSLALDMVDAADPEAPVFLWVHYVDPHWKYGPPKKRWKDQPAAKKCRDLQSKMKRREVTLGNMFVDAKGMASSAFDDCSALYDAEVAFTDSEIGRLIEGLRERGRWDESLRVFTADHGENMGEDDLFFAHGPSLADASLRVPLIIAGPTIPAARYDGGVAIIEDVAPTLLDLAGIGVQDWPEFDGTSLRWRWDLDAEYPMQVAAYAKAESGGALHPDTTNYVVSGRKRSRYCYNDDQYSMCFDAKKSKKTPARVGSKDTGEEEDEDSESEENAEEDAVAAPEAASGGSDEDAGEADDEADFEFYNHQEDPLLEHPLDTVPDEVRESLLEAMKRWSPESARLRAIRNNTHKLVAYPKLEGGYRYALYDLIADPSESEDVKDAHPRTYKRMKAALDDWGGSLPAFVARKRTESELDELRALGYVQ